MKTEKTRKKRGDERKDQELHLRMTKTDMQLLEMASYESEESKSDIIRKALKMYVSARRGHY